MNSKDREIRDLIFNAGKPILMPLGIIQLLFVLQVIISFFLLLWGEFALFGKVFLSGIFGAVVVSFIYSKISRMIWKNIDEKIKANNKNKS
jgi:uncharacterized membrane protein